MRTVVTGCGRFVGSTLTNALLARGRQEWLTRFGTWVQSTSLDELPDLASVVPGDTVPGRTPCRPATTESSPQGVDR